VDLKEAAKALNAAASSPTNSAYPRPSRSAHSAIDKLIALFCNADREERDAATAVLEDDSKVVLGKYAWLKAEEAVRRGDNGDLLRKGLLALVAENGPSDDPRHDVVVIALLFNSAQKLHLDAGKPVVSTVPKGMDPAALPLNVQLRRYLIRNTPEQTAEELSSSLQAA
jgi:hypothetical protein